MCSCLPARSPICLPVSRFEALSTVLHATGVHPSARPAQLISHFLTWPLRSAALILSDGRSHPLSIHAIPAQAAGIGTRSLGTGYISQPFSGGVVSYVYFIFFNFSSYHPLLFATSRGVWCSYSWCLSTPYVEWSIRNPTETILTDHCRCRSQ